MDPGTVQLQSIFSKIAQVSQRITEPFSTKNFPKSSFTDALSIRLKNQTSLKFAARIHSTSHQANKLSPEVDITPTGWVFASKAKYIQCVPLFWTKLDRDAAQVVTDWMV